jgi:hypothetical protein
MNFPEIPETATEEYLEKLEKRILTCIKDTVSQKTRDYLEAFLEKIQERKNQLHPPLPNFTETVTYTGDENPRTFLNTVQLSAEDQEKVKDGLKDVLEEIKQHRPESQQASLNLSSILDSQDENDEFLRTSLDTINLTDQEYSLVKKRMKEMLNQEMDGFEEDTRHELQDEQEEILELGPENEILTAVPSELEVEAEQKLLLEADLKSQQEKPEGLEILTLEVVCRRVSEGESLILFDKIPLSEREQQMMTAFESHLSEMKSLKRQQAFDMQHLTARSIRELEKIFKTYRLQGYLRAELNNVYNRLLNLRSRLSILLR